MTTHVFLAHARLSITAPTLLLRLLITEITSIQSLIIFQLFVNSASRVYTFLAAQTDREISTNRRVIEIRKISGITSWLIAHALTSNVSNTPTPHTPFTPEKLRMTERKLVKKAQFCQEPFKTQYTHIVLTAIFSGKPGLAGLLPLIYLCRLFICRASPSRSKQIPYSWRHDE